MTVKIGVPPSEYWTGLMVPAVSSLSRSYSIFLLQSIQYWSGFMEDKGSSGVNLDLAFAPCRVPSPSYNS